MSDAPSLKPCPFCGGVPYLANVAMPGCSYVVCTDCRMQSDDGSKDRVVKKWNTRNDAALQDLTLQCLAHQGQAQEAYEAQLKAEARITELEAALECVRDSTHHPVELIAIARQVLPKETP